jgi:NADH-quinone oxidoreductase subunit C
MDTEALKTRILELVPEAVTEENKQFLTIKVSAEKLHSAARALKESSDTSFDYMFCMTGVDMQPALVVVYHLQSTKHGHIIVLKTETAGRENPELDSVTDLWRGAELHEDEIYDMFGIKFRNHPNLRRMFMPDDWQGYPLRKDYSDPVNIIDLS